MHWLPPCVVSRVPASLRHFVVWESFKGPAHGQANSLFSMKTVMKMRELDWAVIPVFCTTSQSASASHTGGPPFVV